MEQNRAHQCILTMEPQIITISQEDKLAKPIILISGFLLSLWTNCIFVLGCHPYSFRSNDLFIIYTGLVTHIIISLAATKGLHHGIKANDRIFLKPWMFVKVIESVLLFTASILFACKYKRSYVGFTPVGIILLMIAVYITMCVYTTYKKMIPSVPPTNEHVMPEHPPAYDNQLNMS